MSEEPENITRKYRIDKQLTGLGWDIIPYSTTIDFAVLKQTAVEEYPTKSGPADYAFFVMGKLLGIL